MRKEVMLLLNGETLFPQLFITIVRYVLPSEDHTIHKLFASLFRNFIDKIEKSEIIEPLIPSILHLHHFIRRSAILGEILVDALEVIHKALSSEQHKKKYISYVVHLCSSTSSNGVMSECAGTLVSLSSAPTTIRVLKTSHRKIMVDMIMDVVRALASPNLDIRRKTIDFALELITPHNIDEVVQALKRDVVKTQSTELEKNGEHRQMLVQAIHSSIKFPEIAGTVVHLLMDFLGDSNVASAIDVVHLLNAARVCSCALWIIGEYCLSPSEQCLGDLPFFTVNEEGDGADTSKPSQQVNSITVSSRRPAILADGTYATQSSASETAISPPTLVQGSLASPGNLRSLILTGDVFPWRVVACSTILTRSEQSIFSSFIMLQLGQSSFPHPIDKDSYDRIVLCIRLLCNTGDEIRKIWLQSCHDSFVKMLADKQFHEAEEIKAKAQISHAQLDDDLIDFYHLKSRKDDLKRATVEFTKDGDDANRLNHILQLTGFSDPVYAEAYVTVHHYDIVLDVTVINRAKETLQNLCLELATMGDLKLVERPQNYTLAPESSKQIRANIKTSNVMKRTVVVLNDIHIDIMDYISPATCADVALRTMWAEFEWENKCLTALSVLDGDCGFLAANLYAKSVFGEDALVNVGIEKQIDGKLSGYIRIRSKTQGISLSSLTIYW
ncbi:hypothetical protein MKW92_000928 [Papaver armeniacum]|nr:hypothetical protein MKW92_000928 [Papaver armeniacum]